MKIKKLENNKNLKEKIRTIFFTKNGKINSNLLKFDNYKNNKTIFNLLQKIKNKTNFLNKNVSISERIYCVLNNIMQVQYCPVCNKNKLLFKSNIKGYKSSCSVKCSNNNKIINEKRKNTLLKNYGVTSPLKNKAILQKSQNTTYKRYGEYNINKIKKFREKIEKTNFERYGFKAPANNKQVKEKSKNKIKSFRIKTEYSIVINNLKKDFKFNISENEYGIKGKYGNYNLQCKKCGNSQKSFLYDKQKNIPIKCIICYPNTNSISKIENDIKYFIFSKNNKLIIEKNNKKILQGKELDIYIPEQQLAIEYNGIMWHSIGKHKSSKFNNYFLENDIKKKHLYKTTECNKQNIQLLHIFENERLDKNKQNIWKNIILGKLNMNTSIYGRNTYIKLASNEESMNFLNINHLQGNIPSKLKIGLFSKKYIFNKNGNQIIKKDELISLITFGKSRYGKADWEILRFASKNGINIIGGASKIFKYFLNNYVEQGEKIKTYADLRYSNGDVYKKLGFSFINQSKPNYFYFKTGTFQLESRIKYQKHKLKDKLKNYDKNLSESKNMYNNGYRKIYDCGNLVFEYIK